ncbi:hypothetical protein D3C73_1554490 [compost metagenome]
MFIRVFKVLYSAQALRTGLCYLSILLGFYPGYPDGSDNLAIDHNRHATFQGGKQWR